MLARQPMVLLWLVSTLLLLHNLMQVSADHVSRYFQCPATKDSYVDSTSTTTTRINAKNAANNTKETFLTNPVILKGKRFFDSVTGDYFPVQGIAYYPRPNGGELAPYDNVDYFTPAYQHVWEPDIQRLRALGVNTIRIYAVDPSQNHDAFMCALQRAGIYVILELLADCDGCHIGPDVGLGEEACYPPSLKARGQWIVNEFSKYANLLLFSAGNEVTLYATNQEIVRNAVCQKKFLRDMRTYLDKCSQIDHSILPRKVPVGMVNWDVERTLQTLYFTCRTDPTDAMENAEWYGLNAYQHCDGTAVAIQQLEGWWRLQQDFASYQLPMPALVAEFGCRASSFPTLDGFEAQRTWLQVDALWGDASFIDVFAGGAVFEYSSEKVIVDTASQNQPWPYYGFMKVQYGIGYYSPVDCDHTSTDVAQQCTYIPYPEFDLLARKFQQLQKDSANHNMPSYDDYVPPEFALPTCPEGLPAVTDFNWTYMDTAEDLPCYVIPTPRPTASPTTASPTMTMAPTPSPVAAGGTVNNQNSVTSSAVRTTSWGTTTALVAVLSFFLSGGRR